MPEGSLRALADGGRARRLLRAVVVAGTLCAGVRLLATKLLASLLYHPFRYADDRDHEGGLQRYADAFRKLSYRLDEVEYPVEGAGPAGMLRAPAKHSALLLQPEGAAGSSGLWAVFGGNAMTARDWLTFFLELLSAHAPESQPRPAVLLVDYPGYGANGGQPSPSSVLAGQLAALPAALSRLGARPAQLHLLGHSLGAAAAAQLASQLSAGASAQSLAAGAAAPELGRLVLSAPFVSIEAMAQQLFGHALLPAWLLRLLVAHSWSNAEWVPRAAAGGWQVHIVHGTLDSIVPVWMGRSLRDAVRGRGDECEFVEIPKAGHNDLLCWTDQYASLMGLSPRGSSL